MDYGDLRKYRETDARIGCLEAIENHFNLTRSQILGACTTSGVSDTGGDVWTYYFVAQCLNSARSLGDEIVDYDVDEFEGLIDQEADSCVPYQTYVIWTVWVEGGYDVDPDEMPFYGDDYDIESDLYKIPQAWLYYRARDIIRNYVDERMS